MEKQPYYITVGTGEILPDPTLSEWEFEIFATPEETIELKVLFEETDLEANASFWESHIPHIKYQHNATDERYDEKLQSIYQWLFDHGNEEARTHISSMGILKLTDYNPNKME